MTDAPTARLDHVGIVVPDLDAAAAFLTAHLGFRPLREATLGDAADRLPETFGAPDGSSVRVAFFETDGGTVELLEWTTGASKARATDARATDARAPDAVGTAHLALAVADVDAAAARLGTVPGVTVFEQHRRGFVYVRAPWGLLVQLVAA